MYSKAVAGEDVEIILQKQTDATLPVSGAALTRTGALLHKSRPEDSPHESSVIAGGYEQLDPYEIQDPELGRV